MAANPKAYTWINDSGLEVAGTVTVVPAAERESVLNAFGAIVASARQVDSLDDPAMATLSGDLICVTAVGDAVVVVESNGFQGTRPEVLGPASKASATHVAASFFWNVNAVTAFTAARRGKQIFSVELIGAEDDDLEEVPKSLRRLVIEGGSEDGDMLACGLALVARFTKVEFDDQVLAGGTLYAIDPPPSQLRTYDADYAYMYGLPDAAPSIGALSASRQRQLAQWATRAAVREAALESEPIIELVLDQFDSSTPPVLPPTLDTLVRATRRRSEHFADLEQELEYGGLRDWPDHPYYEATSDRTMFGRPVKAISHLEGAYLAQQVAAVQAVRYVSHPDSLSAAIACVNQASAAFERGRTTRGATFLENEEGRWRTGTDPNPRHQAFIAAVTTLLTRLNEQSSAPTIQLLADATNELPTPLTDQERRTAIEADAQADLDGTFETYQIDTVT